MVYKSDLNEKLLQLKQILESQELELQKNIREEQNTIEFMKKVTKSLKTVTLKMRFFRRERFSSRKSQVISISQEMRKKRRGISEDLGAIVDYQLKNIKKRRQMNEMRSVESKVRRRLRSSFLINEKNKAKIKGKKDKVFFTNCPPPDISGEKSQYTKMRSHSQHFLLTFQKKDRAVRSRSGFFEKSEDDIVLIGHDDKIAKKLVPELNLQSLKQPPQQNQITFNSSKNFKEIFPKKMTEKKSLANFKKKTKISKVAKKAKNSPITKFQKKKSTATKFKKYKVSAVSKRISQRRKTMNILQNSTLSKNHSLYESQAKLSHRHTKSIYNQSFQRNNRLSMSKIDNNEKSSLAFSLKVPFFRTEADSFRSKKKLKMGSSSNRFQRSVVEDKENFGNLGNFGVNSGRFEEKGSSRILKEMKEGWNTDRPFKNKRVLGRLKRL
jgi:hypothetical protein